MEVQAIIRKLLDVEYIPLNLHMFQGHFMVRDRLILALFNNYKNTLIW